MKSVFQPLAGILAAASLAACAGSSPEEVAADLAVGSACGAWENACRRECDATLGGDSDYSRYSACLDRCGSSPGKACRP